MVELVVVGELVLTLSVVDVVDVVLELVVVDDVVWTSSWSSSW